MSAAQVRALQALAEPIAARFDCDLEDVTIRQAGQRRLVRVVLDHDGGLSLDLVAQVSREISRALDASDILGSSPFVLEVTSPGVERPLRLPRHWARAVGRLVAVTNRDGSRVEGRILAADEESAQLGTAAGIHLVGYADVARAVVQVELKRIDEVVLDAEDGDTEEGELAEGELAEGDLVEGDPAEGVEGGDDSPADGADPETESYRPGQEG